jgi:DNA-binding NarL/FixJ family response regulator
VNVRVLGQLKIRSDSVENMVSQVRESMRVAASGPVSSSATVLLVDDEKHVIEGLSLVLRRSPFVVLGALSAAEALGIMRRRKVHVIVADERMPGLSGSELLSLVSREFPATGRVLLTGHATLETSIRAINDGKVCRLLQKPCKPEEFRAAVAEAYHAAMQTSFCSRLFEFVRAESTDLLPNPEGEGAASSIPHPETAAMGAFGPDILATLSDREREVFDLVVDGMRATQIGKALFISHHTVRSHLKAIFGKLDVHSQAELLSKSRGRSD